MKIDFWGATDEVTGSMTFVHLEQGIVMIDCGLVQGYAEAENKNVQELPIKPSEIKAVLLTHAHLDHSGYLPKLVKDGFRGNIYCTRATAKLVRIILRDSASLDKMDLYDGKDVASTLQLIRVINWEETFTLLETQITFLSAGHILGASSIVLESCGKKIVFSGDLGRNNDPLIPAPAPCPKADLIIMESTYGGRIRQGDIGKELHSFLMKISRESRVGIIASFAVARGQMLISLINDFFEKNPKEKFKVVIDGPMMSEANQVYIDYANLTRDPEILRNSLEKIEVVEYKNQWESLRKKHGPLVIISSSGMLTGGRISRHIANWQDDEKAILFLPGYQAQGTPGRSFQEGNRIMSNNKGEVIHWKGEVLSSEAFSSHADQKELLNWLGNQSDKTRVFLIHGESSAKSELKAELLKSLNINAEIAQKGKSIVL